MIKRIIKLSIIFTLITSFNVSATNYRIYANYISNDLGMPRVRLIESETTSYSKPDKNEIWINTKDAVYITVFRRIAHEIYHIKQYRDNNNIFDGYISSSVDFDKYYNQQVEIEAREYSNKILRQMIRLRRKINASQHK